jgi:hypothetical protein
MTGPVTLWQGHVFSSGGGRLFYYLPQDSVYPGPAIPGRAANEYFMVVQRAPLGGGQTGITTAWSDDGLTTLEISDWAVWNGNAGEHFLDPCAIILPNGDILLAVNHIGPSPNPGSISIWLSPDGGRSWDFRNEITPPSPSMTSHKYGEPQMIRIKQPIGGPPNRVMLCFFDFDQSGASDSAYRTVVSDNEFMSYTPSVVATPASGTSSSPGRISDSARACIYEIAEGPSSGNAVAGHIGLVYTRRVGPVSGKGVPAEIWGLQLDNAGNPIPGVSAVKLTTVPEQSGTGQSPFLPVLVGCNPIVQRLSTGEYGLYFTASTFDQAGTTGTLHFMTSPPSAQGDPTQFANDLVVSMTTVNGGGGYGRVWPLPKPNGDIALILASTPPNVPPAPAGNTASLTKVIHYGAA